MAGLNLDVYFNFWLYPICSSFEIFWLLASIAILHAGNRTCGNIANFLIGRLPALGSVSVRRLSQIITKLHAHPSSVFARLCCLVKQKKKLSPAILFISAAILVWEVFVICKVSLLQFLREEKDLYVGWVGYAVFTMVMWKLWIFSRVNSLLLNLLKNQEKILEY